MSKRQRNLFSFDESCPSMIIGISSHVAYYELAHFINKYLALSFCKMNDFFSYNQHAACNNPSSMDLFDNENTIESVIPHPLFFYEDIDNNLVYFLLQNTINGDSIVSSHKQFDYLLIINNVTMEKAKELQMKLLDIKCVLGAFMLDNKSLSNWNLLFDDLALYVLDNCIK